MIISASEAYKRSEEKRKNLLYAQARYFLNNVVEPKVREAIDLGDTETLIPVPIEGGTWHILDSLGYKLAYVEIKNTPGVKPKTILRISWSPAKLDGIV